MIYHVRSLAGQGARIPEVSVWRSGSPIGWSRFIRFLSIPGSFAPIGAISSIAGDGDGSGGGNKRLMIGRLKRSWLHSSVTLTREPPMGAPLVPSSITEEDAMFG